MTDKEFKRLSRPQLIDIIYQLQLKQNELTADNEKLSAELENKRLRLSNAGNIAEAALEIHNIMQSAQDAAALYLEEIRILREDAAEDRQRALEKAQQESDAILSQARSEAEAILAQARTEADAILAQARNEADAIAAQPRTEPEEPRKANPPASKKPRAQKKKKRKKRK